MNDRHVTTNATIIPCLYYRDASKAIDWLCDVFEFERKAVYKNDAGGVMHAELTFGAGMIMLGDNREGPFGRLMKHPREIDGCETQAPYVIVADADEIYARVVKAGCEILVAIKDESYGGRGFMCRDLEGHVWSFGTYDPWNVPAM